MHVSVHSQFFADSSIHSIPIVQEAYSQLISFPTKMAESENEFPSLLSAVGSHPFKKNIVPSKVD